MTVHNYTLRKESTGSWQMGSASYHFAWDALADQFHKPADILNDFFYNYLDAQYFYYGTCLSKIEATYGEDLKVNDVAYTMWTVTTDWQTLTPEEQQKATGINPLDRAPVVSYHASGDDEIFEETPNGDKIVNTADDPVIPAPTRKKYRTIINVEKNFQDFSPTDIDSYCGHTNGGELFGFAANTLLCTNLTAKKETEVDGSTGDQITYYAASFEFQSDTQFEWTLRFLSKGYREYRDGNKVNILDDQGQPISDAALLNGGGTRLAEGEAIPDPLEYDQYEQADFSSLGLDQGLL